MWKYIYVVSHDYDPTTGQFTKVLFCLTDVGECAAAAGSTFPNRHVQLETDYFGVGGPWQVGHVGVSDYNHRYWPLAFQIAKSENKEAVHDLLKFASYMVEHSYEEGEEQPQVTHVLADGGEAINRAIDMLSEERLSGEEYQLFLRRCFAHVIRMGGTRGGGHRGGKGSLPRYLLEQGVPPKVMTKMMSDVCYHHVQLHS